MRGIMLGIAVVAVIVLSACSPPTPTPVPTPDSTTSPSAVVTAPALVEPASAFPGDCPALVPDSAAAAALGSGTAHVAPYNESVIYPLGAARDRQDGSLTCRWTDDADFVSVFLYREADLRLQEHSGEYPFFTDTTPVDVGADRAVIACDSSCTIDARAGDYLLRASGPAEHEGLVALVSGLVGELSSQPEPEIWSAPDGAWPTPLDCFAIEQTGSVASALGSPGLLVEDTTGYGPFDSGTSREIGALGGVTECTWSQRGDVPAGQISGVYLALVAGAGWAFEPLLTTSTLTVDPVDVPGADEAATVCDAAACSVVVRVGENAFSISPRQDDFEGVVATDLLLTAAAAVVAGLPATS